MTAAMAGVCVLGMAVMLAIQASIGGNAEADKAKSGSPVLEALADLADQASKKIRDSKKSSKKDDASDPEVTAKLKALQARLDAVEAERAAFKDELARRAATLEAEEKAKGDRLTGSGSVVPAVLAVQKPKDAPEREPSADEEEAEETPPRVGTSPQSTKVCITETYPRRQGLIRRIFGRCRIFSCFRR